jgi:PIG-P
VVLFFTFFPSRSRFCCSHGHCSLKKPCIPGESRYVLLIEWVLELIVFYSSGMTYYPPKSWAVIVPTSLVCAFFAAPLLYAACNILSTPKVDSIDTIWDEHSREPLGQLVSDNECVRGRVLCRFNDVIRCTNSKRFLHATVPSCPLYVTSTFCLSIIFWI